MSARSSRDWRPGAAFAVSALFALSFFFAGLRVTATGVEYQLFGVVDGLSALLILYVLLGSGALSWPRDAWGAVVVVYAAAATAQLVSLLLPPPGVLEWVVVGGLLYAAWNASYAVHRTRVMLTLGLVALALAALKYSVLPFVWVRTELPHTPILDLRALGEGLKGLVAAYVPSRPVTQALAFVAILAWVLAVWRQWPPAAEDDWLRRLPRHERDRLLFWLVKEGGPAGRPISGEDVRGYLDRPESE
ncbi:MAG: hypothetical protein JSV86_06005 [Gemmatimonadota bacterium]|nr:MAG: hypothetical protein JSV86_06005 [Gemmatimonadota bacterium]